MAAAQISVYSGQELVFEENTLEQLFSSQMADANVVRENLVRISEFRAKLRYVHLEAHLRQRKILDPAQISKYDNLRGYQERSSQSNDRHNMKH